MSTMNHEDAEKLREVSGELLLNAVELGMAYARLGKTDIGETDIDSDNIHELILSIERGWHARPTGWKERNGPKYLPFVQHIDEWLAVHIASERMK